MHYQDVYEIIKTIPQGKVTTYQEIAKKLNSNSTQWIGNALHHNPDQASIPCHRVVNRNGNLAEHFAFGGKLAQLKKLQAEGVVLKKNQTVDLSKCLWKF